LDTLEHYVEAFEFLGRILHREKRGKALADASRRILDDVAPVVAAIPESERIPVYYAQGPDGLKTECDTSVHANLINLSGGRNIRSCEARDSFGMETVSVEEVILGDPAVILAKERAFTETARTSPVWSHVRAVRDGRVVDIPAYPFNWFDRPPSFMRILGLCWLTNLLHPDRFPRDMVAQTRDFYHLFLDVELDEAQALKVLGR
jgi:iron complex transport system substrate-binding protein